MTNSESTLILGRRLDEFVLYGANFVAEAAVAPSGNNALLVQARKHAAALAPDGFKTGFVVEELDEGPGDALSGVSVDNVKLMRINGEYIRGGSAHSICSSWKTKALN